MVDLFSALDFQISNIPSTITLAHPLEFTIKGDCTIGDEGTLCGKDVPHAIIEQNDADKTKAMVYLFNGLIVEPGGSLQFVGTYPAIIVSLAEVRIAGELIATADGPYDSYGNAGGADGRRDGVAADGKGRGAGLAGKNDTNGWGPGGGSYCGKGGSGAGSAPGGSNVGPTYGNAAISPLYGGSSGGISNTSGAGGGALQIYSATAINVLSTGTINAGGGGGDAGGGGSGGALLFEAPQINVTGKIAANGGGGGSQSNFIYGEKGKASDQPALGSVPDDINFYGAGGNGGAGASVDGTKGVAGSGTTYGAGGGGAGWIRFNTADGTITNTGLISPSLAPASGCASVGTLAAKAVK